MSIPSSILMNLLSSGVRAIAGAAPVAPGAPGASDFSSMLDKAQDGELSTGLPVTIGSGLDIELSETQLARLAQAADRAESAGAKRALVLVDGRALELDVASRRITGERTMADARPITGIDAVIDLGGAGGTRDAEEDSGDSAGAGPPGAGLDQSRWNRSLLEVLAQR